MPEECVTRQEFNGLGACINKMKTVQASCMSEKEIRLKTLETWTRNQEDKLDELKDNQHGIRLGVAALKDEVIQKVSNRVTVIVGIMTAVFIAAQFFIN